MESTGSLRRAGCPCPAGMEGLGWVVLHQGEDLGDPYGTKESDLKGFMSTGVPRAARVTGWRHEAWAKESAGV